MVIYIWADGDWEYEWEFYHRDFKLAVRVDLDRLYSYDDLTPLQIKACEEALSE